VLGGRAASQRRATARRLLVRFPLVAQLLSRKQARKHWQNTAAGPPANGELRLDVYWSASRWSLNSCQEQQAYRLEGVAEPYRSTRTVEPIERML
jgi:hypothetical protein